MARVIKFVKGVRNHWKKSLFAAGALSYGVSYGIEKYEIHKLMTTYCREASLYGEVPQGAQQPFSKVLVILNPVADKRSSVKSFEAYCAPILHLAGIKIEVIKTDSVGHARRYIEDLDVLPDAILVAGGDGTLSEAITGLMRRGNPNEKSPNIGILPVGRINHVATNIFKYTGDSNVEQVKGIADATISVVRGKTDQKDVMQVEQLPDGDFIPTTKPVYVVGKIQWGAFRDMVEKRDKYWYFGSFRDYAALLFNAFSDDLTWNCNAKLIYTDPCLGCKNCYNKSNTVQVYGKRWWSSFIPTFRLGSSNAARESNYSKRVNPECSKTTVMDVHPCDLLLTTSNVEELSQSAIESAGNSIPKISIKLGNGFTGFEFVIEGWKRLQRHYFDPLIEYPVRTVDIIPEQSSTEDKEQFYSFDNEAYEVKPIRVTLMPKAINFYVL